MEKHLHRFRAQTLPEFLELGLTSRAIEMGLDETGCTQTQRPVSLFLKEIEDRIGQSVTCLHLERL